MLESQHCERISKMCRQKNHRCPHAEIVAHTVEKKDGKIQNHNSKTSAGIEADRITGDEGRINVGPNCINADVVWCPLCDY